MLLSDYIKYISVFTSKEQNTLVEFYKKICKSMLLLPYILTDSFDGTHDPTEEMSEMGSEGEREREAEIDEFAGVAEEEILEAIDRAEAEFAAEEIQAIPMPALQEELEIEQPENE